MRSSPPLFFIATAEVISFLGARPVFVDICEENYNIDPSKIEAVITERTKAIIPVSLYGQCADMEAINALATKYNIVVIEDACQSFGATQNGKKSCNLYILGVQAFSHLNLLVHMEMGELSLQVMMP